MDVIVSRTPISRFLYRPEDAAMAVKSALSPRVPCPPFRRSEESGGFFYPFSLFLANFQLHAQEGVAIGTLPVRFVYAGVVGRSIEGRLTYVVVGAAVQDFRAHRKKKKRFLKNPHFKTSQPAFRPLYNYATVMRRCSP